MDRFPTVVPAQAGMTMLRLEDDGIARRA